MDSGFEEIENSETQRVLWNGKGRYIFVKKTKRWYLETNMVSKAVEITSIALKAFLNEVLQDFDCEHQVALPNGAVEVSHDPECNSTKIELTKEVENG